MRFAKYHALGNDYLVLQPADKPEMYGAEDIERICHRNFGLGSDGILYGPLESKVADFRMEIWNPDGSQAEKSGNGLRIFSRFLYDNGLVSGDKEFKVETLGGIVKCNVNTKESTVTVDLGQISFESSKIPVTGPSRSVENEQLTLLEKNFAFYAVTIGNPHVVVPVHEPTKEMALTFGPLIENNTEMFPNKTNVQFMSVIDRNNIKIEIWERGAGYTLASGSSSSASAAVAFRMGSCDNHINVHCPGGLIQIHVSDSFDITMTASVTRVGEFNLSEDIFSFTLPNDTGKGK